MCIEGMVGRNLLADAVLEGGIRVGAGEEHENFTFAAPVRNGKPGSWVAGHGTADELLGEVDCCL